MLSVFLLDLCSVEQSQILGFSVTISLSSFRELHPVVLPLREGRPWTSSELASSSASKTDENIDVPELASWKSERLPLRAFTKL